MKKVSSFLFVSMGGLAVACSVTEGEVLVGRDAASPIDDASAPDTSSDASPDATATIDAADACTGADFTSDPRSCGACGHDCLGGACAAGACSPVLLSTASGTSATINGTRVYWASGSSVLSVEKDGSHPLTIASGQDAPEGVFADDANVFWTDIGNGALWRANTDGTDAVALFAPSATGGLGIVADATNVYWVATYAGEVYALSRGAPADAGAPTVLASSGTYAWGAAQDDTHLYWADQGGYPVMNSTIPGVIMSVPKDGSAPAQTIVGGQVDPKFVAVDATGIYWTDQAAGTALRLTPGSTQPQVVFTGQQPFGLALDATYLYVDTVGTDNADGTVVRVAKDGSGTPVVLASGLSWPSELSVDDVAVYWANQEGGGVMKVAK